MNPSGEQCGTCRYFDRRVTKDEGYCRRYPPIAAPYALQMVGFVLMDLHWLKFEGQPTHQVDDNFSFENSCADFGGRPLLDEDDWCGEWKGGEAA